jgi:hypothetical protein
MDPARNTARQVSETITFRDNTNGEGLGVLAMSPTVLIVEDDEILRSLTGDAISLLGISVIGSS